MPLTSEATAKPEERARPFRVTMLEAAAVAERYTLIPYIGDRRRRPMAAAGSEEQAAVGAAPEDPSTRIIPSATRTKPGEAAKASPAEMAGTDAL